MVRLWLLGSSRENRFFPHYGAFRPVVGGGVEMGMMTANN